MVLFLYGPDTYRSSQKLKEIIERHKSIHKSGISFKVFDNEEADFYAFKNAVQTTAMFGEKRLVILKDCLKNKEFCKNFFSWDERKFLTGSKSPIIVFHEEGISKESDFVFWLLKSSKHQEFNLLERAKLCSWAREYAEKNEIAIEPAALTRLALWCKGDLWLFVNEMQKCKAYRKGGKITTQDLRFLTDLTANNIFSLIDAIIAGNRAYAVRALQERLEAGDEELQIFSLVCRQFNVIAQAHANPAGVKKIGLHPFVVGKALLQARRFSNAGIKKIYRLLVDLDVSIKIGKIMPKLALEQLIFSL